jgi:hypothetical protein
VNLVPNRSSLDPVACYAGRDIDVDDVANVINSGAENTFLESNKLDLEKTNLLCDHSDSFQPWEVNFMGLMESKEPDGALAYQHPQHTFNTFHAFHPHDAPYTCMSGFCACG